nr:SDR family NAD(P)-dependent oxidoreductase [Pseudonocardia sp. AL041005-10]
MHELAQRWHGRVVVAAVNGPSSTTVSGEATAVRELVAACEAEGARARWIPASVPGHSPVVDRFRERLLDEIGQITPRPTSTTIWSTVTAGPIDPLAMDAGYWFRNMREPVRFEATVRAVLDRGAGPVIEVSPHPMLVPSITQIVEDGASTAPAVVGTLRRGDGGPDRFRRSVADAFVAGVPIGWGPMLPADAPGPVELPTYAFDRKRFWLDPSGGETGSPDSASDPEGSLYRLEWRRSTSPPVPAPAGPVAVLGDPPHPVAGTRVHRLTDLLRPAPAVLVTVVHSSGTDSAPIRAERCISRTLGQLQDWLAHGPAQSRLVVATRAAQPGPDHEVDPAAAAVWGLVRSAQTENPGRFALVDLDDDPASWELLARAATDTRHQFRIRNGVVETPRLVPVAEPVPTASPALDLARGTVLVTGGTSGLGAVLARHLVARHDVRSLLLVSRRGPDAPGAAALTAQLRAAGADVTVAACDVADRMAVADVLAEVPADRPLCAVVHCAAALEDGVVESLDPARIRAALAAKGVGAWNLQALTESYDLAAFVLFSSVAGTLGTAGQAAYAAANAFLDGLAAGRHARGRPATSLCWGYWAERSDLSAGLRDSDLDRLRRQGVGALDTQRGLALFDAALHRPEPVLLAARLHPPAPTDDRLASLLTTLSAPPARTDPPGPDEYEPQETEATSRGDSPAERLAGLTESEAEARLLKIVRHHTAVVLGHADGAALAPSSSFKELGIDSLTALEVRNGLAHALGTALPATLVFDHPTPAAVSRHLLRTLGPSSSPTGTSTMDMLAGRIREWSTEVDEHAADLGPDDRAAVAELLSELVSRIRYGTDRQSEPDVVARLGSASPAELLAMLDHELGKGTR